MCDTKIIEVAGGDDAEGNIFYIKYFTKNASKCTCYAVCLPDERAKKDKTLLDLVRRWGRYQYRLNVGQRRKGWLIPKTKFPAFLKEYEAMEHAKQFRTLG